MIHSRKFHVLLFLLAMASLAQAAPLFEEHTVWEPHEDGMLTYHVPTIFVSRHDTILVSADARFKEHGDFGPHHIVVKRSTDGGRTWGANTYLARSDGRQIYLFPNFIQARDSNRILFFYSEKDPADIHHVTHVWLRHSDDDGVTWSEPEDVVGTLVQRDAELRELVRTGKAGPEFAHDNYVLYGRKAFFTGPGVAIQLSADHPVAPNRLLVPVLGMQDRWVHALQRGQFDTVLVSDDAGATWRAGGTVPIGDHQNSEPSIVELDNGDLLFNIRVENRGYRVISRSKDGGATWTVPQRDTTLPGFDQVHAGLLRLSFARNDPTHTSRLLISFPNGHPTKNFKNPFTRENMVVWLSYDNHQTWAVRKVINPGTSYYSNMAKLSDGTILLIYGRDGPLASMPERNVVARFNLEWLTDGRDSLAKGPVKE